MSINFVLKYIFQFLFLLFLQIIVFQKIYLTVYCVPFFYSLLILTLPVFLNRYFVLIIAFLLGVIVDAFYHTGGIHASATTLIAYLRYYWLKIIEPSERYEENQIPVFSEMGREWFLKYTLPLVLIHHVLIFGLEAFHGRYVFMVIIKGVLSAIVAEIILYFSHFLFFRPKQ